MAIFNVFKDDVNEVITQSSSAYTFIPDGKTKSYSSTRIIYYHKHRMPPSILSIGGKTYIIPTWKEVHPSTTLEDIIHVKPETEKPIKESKTFTSKSDPTITYKTTRTTYPTGEIKYFCNCPGKWRAKDGMCKHLKSF